MITAILAWSSVARADVHRFAVIVGNNEGFVQSRPLYFAEQDARKMSAILNTLGDVDDASTRVLLGRNRSDVLTALGQIRGLIGPNEFIPLAEDAGLIEAIGGWVLHAVCGQLRAWADAGLATHVHVNVSPRSTEKLTPSTAR